jgi:hypothetical protein
MTFLIDQKKKGLKEKIARIVILKEPIVGQNRILKNEKRS